jgi:hypothetical protein
MFYRRRLSSAVIFFRENDRLIAAFFAAIAPGTPKTFPVADKQLKIISRKWHQKEKSFSVLL